MCAKMTTDNYVEALLSRLIMLYVGFTGYEGFILMHENAQRADVITNCYLKEVELHLLD